jgi:hypothetical protein
VHDVIATVVSGPEGVSLTRIRRAAAPHLSGLAPTYRRMVSVRIVSAAAVYFSVFDPRPELRALGVEVFVADVRIDVLWITRDGRIVADEVKTGARVAAADPAVREQVRTQLDALRGTFGRQSAGVRLIDLTHPAQSVHVALGQRDLAIPPTPRSLTYE